MLDQLRIFHISFKRNKRQTWKLKSSLTNQRPIFLMMLHIRSYCIITINKFKFVNSLRNRAELSLLKFHNVCLSWFGNILFYIKTTLYLIVRTTFKNHSKYITFEYVIIDDKFQYLRSYAQVRNDTRLWHWHLREKNTHTHRSAQIGLNPYKNNVNKWF